MELVCSFANGASPQVLESLSDWINDDPQPDLTARPVGPRPAPHDLGSLPDHLLILLGSGSAATVLASALKAWLLLPQAKDVEIEITDRDRPARSIRLHVGQAREDLVKDLLESLVGDDRDTDEPPES